MKIEFVREEDLSGDKTGIYSVRVDDAPSTLLERFVEENLPAYPDEVENIVLLLEDIGHLTGARPTLFRPREGKPGDGIEALNDNPDHRLRLYCIRNGQVAVILGGGGPKTTRAWQDDPKLSAENKLLQRISYLLVEALKARDLQWSADGRTLLDCRAAGDLILDSDDY